MRTKNDYLDRLATLVPRPHRPFEDLQRRRERKRRNQRIRAGVLGLGLTLAGVLLASGVIRSERETGTTPSASPSGVPDGAFADAAGWITYASGSEVLAVDPADPSRRIVLGSQAGTGFLTMPDDVDPIGWSPDGTRLLFRTTFDPSGGRSPFDLFILDADGTRTTLVDGSDSRDPLVTWGTFSPSGDRVVFGSTGVARGPFLVDADGGRSRPILGPCQPPADFPPGVCGEQFEEAAAWSPNGTIAWADFIEDSPVVGHHAIVLSLVEPNGTGLRAEVVAIPSNGLSLVWSPDGSQLAFWGSTTEQDQPTDIFVIDADGSGLRRLTHEGDNRWPAWSPDGSRIAFVRDGVLHTMAADGSDVREMGGIEVDGAIAWNPLAT